MHYTLFLCLDRKTIEGEIAAFMCRLHVEKMKYFWFRLSIIDIDCSFSKICIEILSPFTKHNILFLLVYLKNVSFLFNHKSWLRVRVGEGCGWGWVRVVEGEGEGVGEAWGSSLHPHPHPTLTLNCGYRYTYYIGQRSIRYIQLSTCWNSCSIPNN
jgi:hypothetical protein